MLAGSSPARDGRCGSSPHIVPHQTINRDGHRMNQPTATYKDQRDELLAALKEIWTTYLTAESTSGGTLAYIAKDAIAKVEGV